MKACVRHLCLVTWEDDGPRVQVMCFRRHKPLAFFSLASLLMMINSVTASYLLLSTSIHGTAPSGSVFPRFGKSVVQVVSFLASEPVPSILSLAHNARPLLLL